MDFKANDKRVEDVLFNSSKKFRIPRYQRPYSWGDDQVTEFWNDLKNEKETYFLGGFIFNYESEEEGYIDVIDGQQRILTITIFIAVLRDICKKFNSIKLSESIQRNSIAFEDTFTLSQTYRIEVGDSTKDYFEKYIQSGKNNISKDTGTTKEEIRINRVYQFLYEKVIHQINDLEDKDKKNDWINKIRKKLHDLTVIKIEIKSEEDAYEIFETTNARGVDLSVSDLLKNVILKHIVNEKRENAKQAWENITKNIESSNTELKTFIRYYWLSKHSFVTDKKLFKAIKSTTGDNDWEELLVALEKDSINWLRIHDVNESEFSENDYESKIFRSISGLRAMKVLQCNVFLLSILRSIDKLGVNPFEVVEFIEKFTFQYSAICKLPANKVEKLYSRYASQIDDIVNNDLPKHIKGNIQRCFKSMMSDLKDLLPDEYFFLDKFNKVNYKQRGLPGYILTRINEEMQSTNEYSIDFKNVNIEHILPQKPKNWGLTPLQVKHYVHLLGNLTLLDESYNKTIGNETLSVKLNHLRKSQLEITKDFVNRLSDDETWSEDQIIDRQARFGKLAYDEIWNV